MLRVPIWITSTSCARNVSSIRTSISSVTIGRPCARRGVLQHRQALDALALERVRARARLERAAAHQPRAAGARRPPRPRPSAARVSTEHGPAITCTVAAADRARRATSTTVLALCHSRATSLYGFRMCSERSTPGIGSNISGIELALVADRADQRALGAARDVDVEAVRADLRFDGGDFARRRRPVASR